MTNVLLTEDEIRSRLDQAHERILNPVEVAKVLPAPEEVRREWGLADVKEPVADVLRHAWDLIDISAEAGPQPEATILRRTDGAGLFYPGARNTLVAPYESAKTWIALSACLQLHQAGKSALYIDFESTPRAIANRMKRIGGIGYSDQFGYIRPTLPVDHDRLQAALDRLQPELVVIDAAAEAMVTHDLDENSNSEYMKFSRLLLEPLEQAGIATLLLDHLGHAGDKPRGASAKLATVSGAALRIEVETPFRPGHNDGLARVFVAKDREGAVRRVSTAETLVAYLHLVTNRDTGILAVELDPPVSPIRQQDTRPRITVESLAARLNEKVRTDVYDHAEAMKNVRSDWQDQF